MAIVMGDLHGNLDKARAFLAYAPAEEHVCLGDYVDSFVESPARQLECLQLLLASEAVLLWGNHDLHYLPQAPWRCSGYQPAMAQLFGEIFAAALASGRLKAAHAADGWLCTHAGVHPSLVAGEMTTAAAAELLNRSFAEQLREGWGSLLNISPGRGGESLFGGIFWFDPFREGVVPTNRVGKQVMGHTERPEPYIAETWVCIDTTNAPLCWVFDTKVGAAVTIPFPL